MSSNSPPAVFIIGVVLVPIVFITVVGLVPDPFKWPVAIGAALIVVLVTRILTRAQSRAENTRADEEGSPPEEP